MNTLKIQTGELKVDLAVQEDKTVITLVKMILQGSGFECVDTKVVEELPTKTVVIDDTTPKVAPINKTPLNFTPKNSVSVKTPPIWIVECEECNDFVNINKTKHIGEDFKCKKCNHATGLDASKTVITYFTCECGTTHNVTIHSTANVVSTKCRSCEMPIDLLWNSKLERYVKM